MRFFFFYLLFVPLFLVSCTDNDDTGDLYGQWQITDIMEGSKTLSKPKNLALSFQGDIVFARCSDHEDYKYVTIPGVFEEKADSLILSFYIDGESSSSLLHNQYLMEGELTNQRFAITKHSSSIVLTKGSRQWRLQSY